MIIGFVGFKGSGKNSAANILKPDFETFAFADSLKDVLATVLCWDRSLLEGDTYKSRQWRETVDPWWSKKLNIENFTPRMAMQLVGTDLFRKHFDENIWITNMERRIYNSSADIAITDCRFPNEIALVKRLGGEIIHIKRGDDPEWVPVAIEANEQNNPELMKPYGVHISEWAWLGSDINYTIINNGTIDTLGENVNLVVNEIRRSI